MTMTELAPAETVTALRSLALDITRKCQAACVTCYNESGPTGDHGSMTRQDWLSVLDQTAEMGAVQVQFIGGEPTLHPDLPELVDHALNLGLNIQVFSNLIVISRLMWRVLRQRGVTVATSYYSDDAAEHEAITKRRGSYRHTKANIRKAIRYRIPVRAALVDVQDGQRLEQATAELRSLGVTSIRTDRVRGIGRGAGAGDAHDISELCGHCTKGRAAVLPDGSVAGCVMSGGMMNAGDVRTEPLASIIGNDIWRQFAASVPGIQATDCNPDVDGCNPDINCGPDDRLTVTACGPDSDGSDCAPAETEACGPSY